MYRLVDKWHCNIALLDQLVVILFTIALWSMHHVIHNVCLKLQRIYIDHAYSAVLRWV